MKSGFIFGTAILVFALIAGAAPPTVEHHRWTLYALVMDATTGAPLYQAPVHDPKTNEPKVFDEVRQCIEAAITIGPVPAHDGAAIMFRCLREDGLPLDQAPSQAT